MGTTNVKNDIFVRHSPFTRFDIFTVRGYYVVGRVLHCNTVFIYSIVFSLTRSVCVSIYTCQNVRENIYNNIPVPKISSTAIDFESKVSSTFYREPKKCFRLFSRGNSVLMLSTLIIDYDTDKWQMAWLRYR